MLDYQWLLSIEGCACAEERTNELMVIGEKGKSQLQRDLRSLFVGTINDTAKSRITFALVWHGRCATPGARPSHSISVISRCRTLLFALQAAAIADELLRTEYDACRVIFNRFQSAIAFKPTIATVLSPDVGLSSTPS